MIQAKSYTVCNHAEYRRQQYRDWLDQLKRTDPKRYLAIRKAMIAKKTYIFKFI